MKWISLKDRLPEEKKYVLVCTSLNQETETNWLEIAYYYLDDEEPNWVSRDLRDFWFNEEVTYWMPLPQKP